LKKIPWVVAGVLAIAVVALGVFIAFTNSTAPLSSTKSETNETKVITFLEKNQEIALVTLGISEIMDEKHTQSVLGFDVPWSEKQTFIKASFSAKLGINGRNVVIREIEENKFEITVPKFVFIGYDDPLFEHVVDNNGVLSFVTDNVDQAEMITKLLNPENQEVYVDKYTDLLKESTESFYKNLIPSFAKDVELTFIYGE